jgi:hypothetical protein
VDGRRLREEDPSFTCMYAPLHAPRCLPYPTLFLVCVKSIVGWGLWWGGGSPLYICTLYATASLHFLTMFSPHSRSAIRITDRRLATLCVGHLRALRVLPDEGSSLYALALYAVARSVQCKLDAYQLGLPELVESDLVWGSGGLPVSAIGTVFDAERFERARCRIESD